MKPIDVICTNIQGRVQERFGNVTIYSCQFGMYWIERPTGIMSSEFFFSYDKTIANYNDRASGNYVRSRGVPRDLISTYREGLVYSCVDSTLFFICEHGAYWKLDDGGNNSISADFYISIDEAVANCNLVRTTGNFPCFPLDTAEVHKAHDSFYRRHDFD